MHKTPKGAIDAAQAAMRGKKPLFIYTSEFICTHCLHTYTRYTWAKMLRKGWARCPKHIDHYTTNGPISSTRERL